MARLEFFAHAIAPGRDLSEQERNCERGDQERGQGEIDEPAGSGIAQEAGQALARDEPGDIDRDDDGDQQGELHGDGRCRCASQDGEAREERGLSRYDLARQFRACLGTSPYRYLILRRLDRARTLIRQRVPLTEAAAAAGFADQSHMTRHFKQAYGLPPGRWASMLA
jgi:AraC-like DNA-binding protein